MMVIGNFSGADKPMNNVLTGKDGMGSPGSAVSQA